MKMNPWLIITLLKWYLRVLSGLLYSLLLFPACSMEPLTARDSSIFVYVIQLRVTQLRVLPEQNLQEHGLALQ